MQEKTGHRQDRSESEHLWHRGGESGQESDGMSKGTRHVMGKDRREEEEAASTEGDSQNLAERGHAAYEMQSADVAVNEETRAEREQTTGAEREQDLPASSSVGARICKVLSVSEVRSCTVYSDDDSRIQGNKGCGFKLFLAGGVGGGRGE